MLKLRNALLINILSLLLFMSNTETHTIQLSNFSTLSF